MRPAHGLFYHNYSSGLVALFDIKTPTLFLFSQHVPHTHTDARCVYFATPSPLQTHARELNTRSLCACTIHTHACTHAHTPDCYPHHHHHHARATKTTTHTIPTNQQQLGLFGDRLFLKGCTLARRPFKSCRRGAPERLGFSNARTRDKITCPSAPPAVWFGRTPRCRRSASDLYVNAPRNKKSLTPTGRTRFYSSTRLGKKTKKGAHQAPRPRRGGALL